MTHYSEQATKRPAPPLPGQQAPRPRPQEEVLPIKRGSDGGSLSHVAIKPANIEFETQNKEESLYLLLRRHFITNFPWLFMGGVLFAVPIVLLSLHEAFNLSLLQGVPWSYIVAFLALWYLVFFSYILLNFIGWFFNVYLITDERILDYDFEILSQYRVSEAGLESVEDITHDVVGLFPALFNYGNIEVQTAGEKREFEFAAVPKPAWVRDKIADLAAARKKEIERG